VDKALQQLAPFVRDTKLTVKPRVYYFDEKLSNGTVREAVAGGGSLEYSSGWLSNFFRIGAEVFTSQRWTIDSWHKVRSRDFGYAPSAILCKPQANLSQPASGVPSCIGRFH